MGIQPTKIVVTNENPLNIHAAAMDPSQIVTVIMKNSIFQAEPVDLTWAHVESLTPDTPFNGFAKMIFLKEVG